MPISASFLEVLEARETRPQVCGRAPHFPSILPADPARLGRGATFMTNDAVDEGSRLRVVVGMLLALGAVEATLLWSGRRDFLYLHTILDTAMFLLSGILSLLLANIGMRLSQPLLRRLAVTFSVTSFLELLHVLTTVDFASRLTAYPTPWRTLYGYSTWPAGVPIAWLWARLLPLH